MLLTIIQESILKNTEEIKTKIWILTFNYNLINSEDIDVKFYKNGYFILRNRANLLPH